MNTGREAAIRTRGPCHPKTVLYQAELLPDRLQTSGFRQPSAWQALGVGSGPLRGKPEKVDETFDGTFAFHNKATLRAWVKRVRRVRIAAWRSFIMKPNISI